MSASDGRRPGVGSALLGLLAIAVTAGVMVTVGVAPAIALTGVSAKNGIGLFQDLPGELKLAALSQKSELYGTSNGKPKLITSFYTQDRDVVGWNDLGPVIRNAALGAEDPRFYQHGGVDPQSIVRAALSNVLGKNISGASTITQQYVKNVCLQEAERISDAKKAAAAATECDGVTLSRKVREMRYAIGLEKRYPKDTILLGYLNIALFGGQVYGVEAAAEHYFGKHAKDLTVAQAASLMAMVQSPNNLRIDIKANIPANTDRRDYVLGRELANNLITQEQYTEAIATKVKPNITYPKTGCQAAGTAAYFCSYVEQLVQNDTALGKAFGAKSGDRAAALYGGGLKIYTSLDLDLQKKAAATMKEYVPFKPDARQLASAGTTVEVGTGRVLTMTQSKHYGLSGAADTQLNYSVDGDVGGGNGFEVGSTWKLFDLLEWLKQGHGVNEVVNGNERYIGPFNTCNGGVVPGQMWGNDSSSEGGFRTVYSATANSVNGAFMTMVQKLNLCDIVSDAKSLGVHNATGKPLSALAADMLGSGANTIAPLTMAAAYAGIAAQGKFCAPMAIDKVIKPGGGTMPIPGTDCKQALDKGLAIAAGYTLHGVLNGTATTDANGTGSAFQFAKTGTTDDAKQTWLVGGSTRTVTAVWVGNVNSHADNSVNLRDVYGWPTCQYQNYNGQAALTRHCLWHDMRQAAEDEYPGATSWPDPASQYLTGQLASVPNVAGMTVDAATSVLTTAGFQVKVGKQVDSDVAQGSVAATDPQAGQQAPAGTKITLLPSSGTPAQGSPVPDVFGQTLQNARTSLQQAGFTNVQVNFVQGNGSCQVQGTNPGSGTAVPSDTTVTLQVAGAAVPVNGSFECQ